MTKQTTLEGWQLVPVEPTEAMIEAGDDLIPVARGTESRRGIPSPETIYRAMLSAAPRTEPCGGMGSDDTDTQTTVPCATDAAAQSRMRE